MIYVLEDESQLKLLSIQAVAPQAAREIISKIGSKVRDNARSSMKRKRHNWLQKPNKKGGLSPYLSSSNKELGRRTNKDGSYSHTPRSMANFVTSFMNEERGTLVVGGLHKGFNPVLRKDGKIVGKGRYVKGIGTHSQSIIHKLDTGERNKHHGWFDKGQISKKSMAGGSESNGLQGRAFKGRGFMKQGIAATNGYVGHQLSKGFEDTVGRALNRKDVNIKRKSA